MRSVPISLIAVLMKRTRAKKYPQMLDFSTLWAGSTAGPKPGCPGATSSLSLEGAHS